MAGAGIGSGLVKPGARLAGAAHPPPRERQLLFMGFTIFARILLSLATYPIGRLRHRAPARAYYG